MPTPCLMPTCASCLTDAGYLTWTEGKDTVPVAICRGSTTMSYVDPPTRASSLLLQSINPDTKSVQNFQFRTVINKKFSP